LTSTGSELSRFKEVMKVHSKRNANRYDGVCRRILESRSSRGRYDAGMMAANAPVVFLAFAKRLPLKAIHIAASFLFPALGALFIWRAIHAQ
jgi:hypothetical protein